MTKSKNLKLRLGKSPSKNGAKSIRGLTERMQSLKKKWRPPHKSVKIHIAIGGQPTFITTVKSWCEISSILRQKLKRRERLTQKPTLLADGKKKKKKPLLFYKFFFTQPKIKFSKLSRFVIFMAIKLKSNLHLCFQLDKSLSFSTFNQITFSTIFVLQIAPSVNSNDSNQNTDIVISKNRFNS